MKKRIFIALFFLLAFLGLALKSNFQATAQQDNKGRVPPDVIILAETAKLGKVTFNHGDHSSKNYNLDGTAPISCVGCHHVEQPLSEAMKSPRYKSVYPADRTATLTLESLKDPKTPGVTACRSCHIQKDGKSTILKELPQIENEKTKTPLLLTNQNAFHKACADCHEQVVKARPDVKAPTAMKCAGCHKKV